MALTRLGVSGTVHSKRGIAQVHWPGRLEHISERPEIILDGAHNPAGARALAAYIERFYCGRRVRLIYGAMRDKAVEEIGGMLFPLAAAGDRDRAPPVPRPGAGAMREIAGHPGMQTAPGLRGARSRQGCRPRGRHLHHRLALPGSRGSRPAPESKRTVSRMSVSTCW